MFGLICCWKGQPLPQQVVLHFPLNDQGERVVPSRHFSDWGCCLVWPLCFGHCPSRVIIAQPSFGLKADHGLQQHKPDCTCSNITITMPVQNVPPQLCFYICAGVYVAKGKCCLVFLVSIWCLAEEMLVWVNMCSVCSIQGMFSLFPWRLLPKLMIYFVVSSAWICFYMDIVPLFSCFFLKKYQLWYEASKFWHGNNQIPWLYQGECLLIVWPGWMVSCQWVSVPGKFTMDSMLPRKWQ